MSEQVEKEEKGQKDHPFISYLERITAKEDGRRTKVLAHLKKGLGKRMGTPSMYPYVVSSPWFPEYQWEQALYFLVASLFALYPDGAPRGRSIGETFRKVYVKSGRSESIEGRFKALLASNIEDVGRKLRSIVSLAKSKGIAIDYHRLLRDLENWDHPDGFVQMAWARDFWGHQTKNNDKK